MAEKARRTQMVTAEKVRRTQEEIVMDIDAKIQYHKDCIEKLQKKKDAVLNPKKHKSKAQRIKAIVDEAKKTMTPEEMAQKLGIDLE